MSGIDFRVLLRSPEKQTYQEAVQMRDILMHHSDDAIAWLRRNNPIVAGAFQSAGRMVSSQEPIEDLNKIVLLLLARCVIAIE